MALRGIMVQDILLYHLSASRRVLGFSRAAIVSEDYTTDRYLVRNCSIRLSEEKTLRDIFWRPTDARHVIQRRD